MILLTFQSAPVIGLSDSITVLELERVKRIEARRLGVYPQDLDVERLVDTEDYLDRREER